MKKKYLIILLLTIIIMPFKVFAAGGFGVSSASVSLNPGQTKTITITTNNAVGKLNIQLANSSIATVNTGSIFIQNPGQSGSITITAKSVGTTTISVVASDNFATMDEEILAGQTKTITVNVVEKQTQKPSDNNNNNKPQNNYSNNNKLKSIEVEGYKLVKADNNNYTLTVSNEVTSVKINATAEDSKAKVTGTGTKELKVGENTIEVIVTAENGAKNTIKVKITRKDGYYLEDLDLLLKNNKIIEADIIIKEDSKITKEEIEKIKNSKKIIRFNCYDENKKLLYSWIIDGNKVKDSNEIVTTILYTSEKTDEISKLSNYADGINIVLNQVNSLPKGTKIRLYVGDKYEDGNLVNIYYYNNNKLELVNNGTIVKEDFIEIEVDKGGEFFITKSNINNMEKTEDSSFNIFLITSIIELIVILGMAAFIFIKIKPLKKENNNNMTQKNTNEFNNNINNNNLY